jgi:hypothetical protein
VEKAAANLVLLQKMASWPVDVLAKINSTTATNSQLAL